MKFSTLFGNAALFGFCCVLSMPANAVPLVNTGADFTGGQDNRYVLLSGHGGTQTGNAQIVTSPNGLYTTAPPGSQYISINSAADAASSTTFYFQTTFTSTGGGSITGDVSADNSATVYLNGILIGSATDFTKLYGFDSSSAGQVTLAGTNILEFDVVNDADTRGNPTNPMALLATNLEDNSTVPEIDPNSAAAPAAICLSLLLLANDRRRRTVV